MNKKQILSLTAVAAVAMLAPRVNSAEAEVKTHIDTPEHHVTTDRDADVRVSTSTDASRSQDKIRHGDKASGILGMEVRNRENQKLGEIKDLVLDVNSGKIDYAVLAVGGFLGIGEKLIALPPNALKQAQDGEYLVLDADKSKIQAAPGFAATAWPSKNDPEVSSFWRDVRATGAPGRSESSHKSDVDVDTGSHRVKGEVNLDTDKNHKIYTDADKDKKVKVDVDTK